jgi:hypothetical protein
MFWKGNTLRCPRKKFSEYFQTIYGNYPRTGKVPNVFKKFGNNSQHWEIFPLVTL